MIDEPESGPRRSAPELEAAHRRLKTGRNKPCPCGSGRKYKTCCLEDDQRLARAAPESFDMAHPDGAPLEEDVEPADEVRQEFEALTSPSLEQMDAYLEARLALPAESLDCNELFDALEARAHPDLPAVFRRIADAVSSTAENSLGFFYWNVAEAFTRAGCEELLPEVADRFRTLDSDTYDVDALFHIADFLLAAGQEKETLKLAEHFLPILRADDHLMPNALPELCVLIFELRVGLSLRDPGQEASTESLAGQLLRGFEGDLRADAADEAVAVIAGRVPAPAWTRDEFELPPPEAEEEDGDDTAWQQNLRLNRMLMHVAREAWQVNERPPGCTLRGLLLIWQAVATEPDRRRKGRATPSRNLLDSLAPAGMEERLVGACPGIYGVNVPRARLYLDAQEGLLRCAERHALRAAADTRRTAAELGRLRRALQRVA